MTTPFAVERCVTQELVMAIDPDQTRGALAGDAALAEPTAHSRSSDVAVVPAGVPHEQCNEVELEVNGKVHRLALDPRTTLLDTLRERLALHGTKKGCDHGQCGACTVHIDGRRVLSCLTLALQARGKKVTTIEGLASADGRLHPMQQAFLDHDALQCGYCTPGQIMSAIACVSEGHVGSADEIREYMSGNLCRCGAYVGILAAIQDVAGQAG
jgi:xanthine dehydrogenase YagT iron-sulfur-binding subunit